jgi:MinD-like ATPase involved in chromosome partitioning or flagellar assembly
MQGKRTCLLDVDFRAPSIGSRLEIEGHEFFVNDYLNGNCKINNVLIDYTSQCKCAGTMLVGLANPAAEALRDMSAKGRKWEMRALGRLLSLKNILLRRMKIDYLILDTSSGIQYSAINAIVSSDVVLLVNNLDKTQVKGTQVLIEDLYSLFEKKTGMVVNKAPLGGRSLTEVEAAITVRYENLFGVPILGVMPCFCEVLEESEEGFFPKDHPEHLFTKILEELASRLERFSSGSAPREDSELMKLYKELFIKKVTGVRL